MSNINFFRIFPKLNGSGTVDEPFTSQGQDHFRITYTWTQGDGGDDLDTYTGFAPGTGVISGGTNYDGVYGGTDFANWVGYAAGGSQGYIGPGNFSSGNYYIAWAGDNTSSDGKEDILINIEKVLGDVTSINNFEIELYGRWYDTIGTGEIDVTLQLWTGGTWSDSGLVWSNSGGTLLDTLEFSIDCLRGTGIGNKLDFANYPPPNTTTYKAFGTLSFIRDGSGNLSYNLDSA